MKDYFEIRDKLRELVHVRANIITGTREGWGGFTKEEKKTCFNHHQKALNARIEALEWVMGSGESMQDNHNK